ncbi:MAG: RnfABCDGE type electron transport complex subunit C [Firmicutes bacterium]|nr:RnfABCDGE type electron transport complex subunit C [Bacillota bacterium]
MLNISKHHKVCSRHLPICEMPPPDKVYIPLVQHVGKPAKPIVSPADKVKKGQLIGEADTELSANVFSCVAGTVVEIAEMDTPYGKCAHVVIENNRSEDLFLFKPLSGALSREQILQRIREAGIVGMGGAGFPTAYKLASSAQIHTLILNAAESEPFSACDFRILKERPEQFLRGALLLSNGAGAEHAVVALGYDNRAAADELNKVIAEQKLQNIKTTVLKPEYPQGAEKKLVYAVTGKKVAPGKLPPSVGALVCNVHTALSAYYAVYEGRPLYSRLLTVSGDGVHSPANVCVPLGALFSDVLEFLGGYDAENTVRIIGGGPMTGLPLLHLNYACEKRSHLLALLTESRAQVRPSEPCIRCTRCVKACPMKLMPLYIDAYSLKGDIENAARFGLRACIRCGSCAYVCPSRRPLVQSVILARNTKEEAAE